jgi:hypothetical protein
VGQACGVHATGACEAECQGQSTDMLQENLPQLRRAVVVPAAAAQQVEIGAHRRQRTAFWRFWRLTRFDNIDRQCSARRMAHPLCVACLRA